MAASEASFRAALEKLIRRFESDKSHYLSKRYNEAQARIDFITPFFKALGWDVENEQGLAPHSREVTVEVGEDTRGRPDYSFRVSGQTKFFVEAKAPSEELDTARHILQAKTYAWNTKQVFFVVLTDFEEFRFYDASIQPDIRKPEEGLLLKLRFADYLANLSKLWEFSLERVAAGSLEAMLPRDRRTQRLRIPVDTAFLDEMTGWREDLARNIYKNNPALNARQLNEIVQRLLDRIVFIRIAEDRRIIEKNQLRDAVEEWHARGGKYPIFDWLGPLFEKINEDFNGEIFKPNELLEKAKLSSEVLAKIIERLYPPKSPYRFDVIGVELLGSIYERYLGNTIRVTPKQVRVEEKPEVRKAGGVYYTPKYIVDYIVKETVGKLIEGKSPKQIEKIRILDPACGSGSFLIGAFQCLIDYHVRYLSAHPEESRKHGLFPDIMKDENGELRLSVLRKAEILKNNLYGVDIDPQAVEITMMSLYLKALEGERSQLPPKQHLLPELKYNIVCGNSLIQPDVYGQGQLFADDDRGRINAFDWSSEAHGFGEIIKLGGFDCVLANPPYIRIQTLQEFSPIEAEYLKKYYRTAASGNFDIYVCFVEKGLSLLAATGKLGFILPSKFFQTDYGEALRQLLVETKSLERVVDFAHLQVFDGPTTYTSLLFLTRRTNRTLEYLRIDDADNLQSLTGRQATIALSEMSSAPWTFANPAKQKVFRKIEAGSTHLIELPTHISRGSSTGDDDVFIVRKTDRSGRYTTRDGQDIRLEPDALRIPLFATDFGRYDFRPAADERIIFPYSVSDGASSLLGENDLKRHFPRTFAYLSMARRRLETRKQFSTWYSYSAPRSLSVHDTASLLVPLLADRGLFSVFPPKREQYCLMASAGFSIKIEPDSRVSAEYLLGVLNSKLLFSYLKSKSNVFRGGWVTCTKQYVGPLPILVANIAQQESIGRLVERILDLNQKKHRDNLAPSELQELEREISATDAEIDDFVFRLYDITTEEQRIIEGTDT